MKLLIYLIMALISTSLVLAKEEDEILKILNKTYKKRIVPYPNYDIYDPFQKAMPVIKKAKRVKIKPIPTKPKVKAIINNSAYIDGKWREVGDNIRGYKLVKINSTSVVLELGDKNITIPILDKGEDSIIIIDRKKR